MKKIAVFLVIILLLFANVFAQRIDLQKNSDRFLLERVEKYLNSISFFDRLFLNIVIEKIDPSGSNYIRLDKDVLVKLIISSAIDCRTNYYIDYGDPTDLTDATIYITSGFFLILKNEAEIAASIAHELGHLSSLHDRVYSSITNEEYLECEMAADRMGILITKEIGYKPEALADLFRQILSEYSDKLYWIRPKELFVHRFLAAKKLTDEIRSQDQKEYKKYLYFTEIQFKTIKKIVKYLQDKSGT